MLGATLKDESFDRSSHPSVQEYIRQNRGSEELQEVVVNFDKKVVRYLQEQKYLNGFVSEEDLGDYVSMKFLTSSIDYFGRWLLPYCNTVTIESPTELRTIMKELSQRLLAHYGTCGHNVVTTASFLCSITCNIKNRKYAVFVFDGF